MTSVLKKKVKPFKDFQAKPATNRHQDLSYSRPPSTLAEVVFHYQKHAEQKRNL